jgi:glutamate formiminotransferase/formiminotetrahydrofolate cyclodeaminase
MMDAMRLPKKTDEEITNRNIQIESATQKAILVPFKTIELALDAVKLAEKISKIGNTNALSDAGVGALTAQSAAAAAYLNVKINLSGLTDVEFGKDILAKSLKLKNNVDEIAKMVFEAVDSKL